MAKRKQLDLEKDAPKVGHNSNLSNDARAKLSAFVERIERLEEEKAGIAGDIKDVYDEADSDGFDKKAIRAVIRLRKLDKHERREAQQAMIETYSARARNARRHAARSGRNRQGGGGTMKPICVPCQRFFRMKRSGYYFTEGMPNGQTRPAAGKAHAHEWKPL